MLDSGIGGTGVSAATPAAARVKANALDLLFCLAMWVVPLAAIGLTELGRRRRSVFRTSHGRGETRSDPSAEMWSAAMAAPPAGRGAR